MVSHSIPGPTRPTPTSTPVVKGGQSVQPPITWSRCHGTADELMTQGLHRSRRDTEKVTTPKCEACRNAVSAVGVDGSDAAINATKWAVDEAISRDVPLRIVHVMHIEEEPAAPADAFRLDVQYAESSLRARPPR